MMAGVVLYGFTDCNKCEAAKAKLLLLNIPYEERSYQFYTTLHPGWRTDGSIQIMAARNLYGDDDVPLISHDGKVFNYAQFIKYAKSQVEWPTPVTSVHEEEYATAHA